MRETRSTGALKQVDWDGTADDDDIDDNEPIFQMAVGGMEPAGHPIRLPSDMGMGDDFVMGLGDAAGGADECGPAVEIEGTSRTGRPRKPTFRYSPEVEKPNRRRREKTTTPDEKMGDAAPVSPIDENISDQDNEQEREEGQSVDGDEGKRGARGKRLRRASSGLRAARLGKDVDSDGPESAGKRRGGLTPGRGRGRGRGAAGKRQKSVRIDDGAEDADAGGKSMSKDEDEGTTDNKEPPPTRKWSCDEDRQWDRDIVHLKSLFSDFCRKEDEAKALRNKIQDLLVSWTQKSAPSTDVLTFTMAGKYLKSSIIRRAQEGSLLDPTYPKSVLTKWKREVAGPKPTAPTENAAPLERETAGGREGGKPAEPTQAPGTPKAQPVVDAPVESTVTHNTPKAVKMEESSDTKLPIPIATTTAVGQSKAMTVSSVTAIKVEQTSIKRDKKTEQLVEEAAKLEAREPSPSYNVKGDECRDKGLAILMESLQPEVLPTQMAVLLEEMLYQSCPREGVTPGIEYKRGLHKIWSHVACEGDHYNVALRYGLLSGKLAAEDFLKMEAQDMKSYGTAKKPSTDVNTSV